MKVVLNRLVDTGKETLGKLTIHDELKDVYECKTLELSWKDNKQNISCIPFGEYLVSIRTSEKYGEHFIVNNVEDRSYILIHQANYHTQLRGCIAVGKKYSDINSDGELDVTSSKNTMKDLLEILPDSFYLNII
tara:strand:- start:224 stop:625 length:402 start_codon:yes stop_codon:yes gene_type:complete